MLAGFAARSRAVSLPGRIGYDATAGWLVARAWSAGGDWGRLVFVLPGPPDANATVVAERTAATLTLARLTRGGRAADRPLAAAHRSVLAALACRALAAADPLDLEARVVALGLPISGRQLVPVVIARPADASPADGQEDVAAALDAACHDLRIPAIAAALHASAAAALLALAPGADQDATLTRLALRLRRAGVLGPWQFMGVATAVGSVGELRSAFSKAENAACAAAVGPPLVQAGRPPFVRLEDLGLGGLAYQLRDDPRVLAFAEHQLGPLLLHDAVHGTGLARVLAAYLDSGGNKAATAARCGVSRPTLYERLHQIEDVLRVRLDDGASRTTLHAALLIRGALLSDRRPDGTLSECAG